VKIALDLDGTLITCEPRQSAVLEAALKPRRLSVDTRRVWGLKRKGASTEDALVTVGLSRADAREVARDWRRMIEAPAWLALDQVIDGVYETLDEMCCMSAHLMLLTARSRREWLEQQLRHLRLSRFFRSVIVVSPERATQEKAQCLSEESVAAFIGDTESDMRAASSARVAFYAVETGQRDAAFLARASESAVYSDLASVWNKLKSDSKYSGPSGRS
jgi:phosphoglycolate phosphatase-like HAD superfamily hydrolase